MSDTSASLPGGLNAFLREKHQQLSELGRETPEQLAESLTILALSSSSKGGLSASQWAPENLAKRQDTTLSRQKLSSNYPIGNGNPPSSLTHRLQKNTSPPPKHPAGWVAPHLRYLQKGPSNQPPSSSSSSSQGGATTEKALTPSPPPRKAEQSTAAMPSSISNNSISTGSESDVGENVPHLQQKVGGRVVPSSNWASICPVKATVKVAGTTHTPSTPPRTNGNTAASIQSASGSDKPTTTQFVPPHLRKSNMVASNPSTSTQAVPPHLRKGNAVAANPPTSTAFVPPHLRKNNTGISHPESPKSSSSSNGSTSTQYIPPHLRGTHQPAASTQYTPPHLRISQQPAATVQLASPSAQASPSSSAAPSVCGSSSSTMNGAAKTYTPRPASLSAAKANGYILPRLRTKQEVQSPPVTKANDYILPHLRTKQGVQSPPATKAADDIPPHLQTKQGTQSFTRENSRTTNASASVSRELGPASSADAFSNPPVARSNDYIPPHLRTKSANPIGSSTSSQVSGAPSTDNQIKISSSAAGSTTMENLPPHLRFKKAVPASPENLPQHLRAKTEGKPTTAATTPDGSKPLFVPPHLQLAKRVEPSPAGETVPPHLRVNKKDTPITTTEIRPKIEVSTVKTTPTPIHSSGGVSLTNQNAPRPTTPTNRLTPASQWAQWGSGGAKLLSGDEFFEAARRSSVNTKPDHTSPSLAVSPKSASASPERTKSTITQGTHGRQLIVEKYVSGPTKETTAKQPNPEDTHLANLITQTVHQTIEVKEALLPDPRTTVDKSNMLTDEALAQSSGFGPSPSARGSDFRVSEEGVEQPKEGIRARQGISAAEELMDWTGALMPPPCDWEIDRTWFDNQWTPEYIAEEWRLTVPSGSEVEISTHSEEFLDKLLPINPVEPFFLEAVYTEDSRPDVKNSENEQKRLHYTSQREIERRLKKQRKHLPTWEEAAAELATQEAEAIAYEPEPNRFAPKIDIYLRPATLSDALDVTKIYNYYICNTNIPEDQSPIFKGDAEFMIKNAQEDGLPFIVAIKGKAPVLHDVQGRPVKNKKASLPACEVVGGFIFAEALNYNVKGNRKGRSRTTANLQLYVAPDSTRKGVGRNLLDHMLHSLKSTHSFENACDWLNVDNDKLYTEGNLNPTFHQLMFQLPVLQKGDPYLEGVTQFLSQNNLFRQEARLFSVGRTAPEYGSPKWLDLVYFQAQAWQSEAFGGLS